MRKIVKLTGMLLMLILAGNFSLSAQRAMRGTMDSTHLNMMKMRSDTIHRHRQEEIMNPYGMRGLRPDRGFDRMVRGVRFPDRTQMYGMRGGNGHDSFADAGNGMRGFGRGSRNPGEYMLASIPNVTEKQKKDITELKQKQQDEMKKLRDDMSAKVQAMRDSYKKSIMSVFTDEQKKFIESQQPETAASPSKTK